MGLSGSLSRKQENNKKIKNSKIQNKDMMITNIKTYITQQNTYTDTNINSSF
jgi:hypothetical protein